VAAHGLLPNTLYPAHVHNAACAAGAGTHYQIVQGLPSPDQNNEIWLNFTSDANGVGVGSLALPDHLARADALSIVIHDPVALSPMACLDLTTPAGFTNTAVAGSKALDINGTAKLSRNNDVSTTVQINVSGLLASTAYVGHVHSLPCRLNGAGGHYEIDPTQAAGIESNEMWVHFMTDATGAAVAAVTFTGHVARADAQAFVIHDPVDKSKLACADLD
jgi:hypothetical protein